MAAQTCRPSPLTHHSTFKSQPDPEDANQIKSIAIILKAGD